ncbi:MAG: hypothetical protein WCD11_09955 [Solirubrobacteraceae bacterium]
MELELGFCQVHHFSRSQFRHPGESLSRQSTQAAPGEPPCDARSAPIAYLVIGVMVPSQHTYYAHLGSLSQVLSAPADTALWPLVLLGADLHLSLANL